MFGRFLLPAALIAASPAAAQEGPSPEAVKILECAMWAAMVAGTAEDAQAKSAFEYAMTYWIGQFEGMSGTNFDKIATEEFVTAITSRADEIQAQCTPLMLDMGERMQSWGASMQQAGSAGS